MLKGKRRFLIPILILAVMFFVSGGYAHLTQPASAGPSNGQPMYRAAAIDESSRVQRSILLDGPVTMANTTPVNGSKVCINGDADTFAASLTLTGTLTGTNPVITVVLQASDDNGVTWRNVGSNFAAINATVTPTGGQERVTFADTEAGAVNTPVIWGDCFRVRTTFGGTGTVTANVDVRLYAE